MKRNCIDAVVCVVTSRALRAALCKRCVTAAVTAVVVPLVALAGCAETVHAMQPQSGTVRIERQGDKILVVGLQPETLAALRSDKPDWQSLFAVRVGDRAEAAERLPPVLGKYTISDEAIQFIPRYALRPGLSYTARLEVAALPGYPADSPPQLQSFEIPDAPPSNTPATTVEAIYPTSSVLPENQLKFYLHFSAPMARGQSYRHIRLLKADGTQVEFPFLELGEELWDPQLRRFTLFFDPGRIKRGLKPREQFGPSLEEGQKYVLEIDTQWPDAQGRPLAQTVTKEFRVVAPDDTQPDPQQWQIKPPQVAQDPLTVVFDEPLDRGMLERVLRVEDAEGTAIAGEITIDEQETRWRFQPATAWQPGEYWLVVATNIEDRAGNSLARTFEVDLFDTVQRSVVVPELRLPWKMPK